MNEIECTVYNAPALAKAMGISRTAAYNLMNRADFPSFRAGRKPIVRVTDLDEWIDEQVKKERLRKEGQANDDHKRMGIRSVAAGCNGRGVPGGGSCLVQAGRAARPEGGPEDVRDVQEVWRRA